MSYIGRVHYRGADYRFHGNDIKSVYHDVISYLRKWVKKLDSYGYFLHGDIVYSGYNVVTQGEREIIVEQCVNVVSTIIMYKDYYLIMHNNSIISIDRSDNRC